MDRRNDLRFADAFLEEVVSHDMRTAMLRAGRRQGWEWAVTANRHPQAKPKPYNDRQVLRRARKILDREGVVAYLSSLYEARGFSPLDGVDLLIDHAKGNLTKQVATKEGAVVEVKIPPSLDALKLYFSQTTEEQTKKIQIDSRSLVAHRMIDQEPPAMRARVLKAPAHAELPGT